MNGWVIAYTRLSKCASTRSTEESCGSSRRGFDKDLGVVIGDDADSLGIGGVVVAVELDGSAVVVVDM